MNGHLVDELLLIFFADTVSDFSKMFIDMVSKYHSDLCQSVYYYEFDSNIVAISGGSLEDASPLLSPKASE